MDSYLEAPEIWPDLHDALAGEIRGVLNATLPAPYSARLEMRPEVGIVDEGEAPRATISESVEFRVSSEPIRHAFVEIRDPSRGHQLVTLIEIVSPSNKRPGPDRQAYLQKQREVLESDANLIELDLLRRGERLLPHPELPLLIGRMDPVPDYLVVVNRAWQRVGRETAYQVFPVVLTGPLPCISVPLREGQAEVPLDLQFAFNRAYDTGPYRRGAVDYGRLPEPPLPAELAAWAEQLLRPAGGNGPDGQ
jgi:hypothetical protein